MRALIMTLLLFSSLISSVALAKIDLPWFANPNCVLGLNFDFINDKEHRVISSYHKDNLFKLLTRALIEDKKYYVVILKADEAPLKLSSTLSVDLKNENELSCTVTSQFMNGDAIARTRNKTIDGILPISQEAFTLCYDLIFTEDFRTREACK